MLRIPVKSSDIKSAGYDAAKGILEIEFHSGSVYQYLDVESAVWIGLVFAESKGKYFHNHIKGKFEYARVDQPA